MTGKLFRQGDVLLTQVDALPGKTQVIDPSTQQVTGRLVLAYGEATGHHHSITKNSNVALLETVTENATEAKGIFLSIMGDGATLVHQEHAPIKLPTGDYKVTIQKEYTPEAIQNVID